MKSTGWFLRINLFLLISIFACPACHPEKTLLEGDQPAEVCDEYDMQECSCPVAGGYQFCLADKSGYGECVCAISEAVVGDHVKQIDELAGSDVVNNGERGISAPSAGNEALADLKPGDYVQSWDLGLMGQVTSVTVTDGVVTIETEPCALTDIFETLSIDYNRPLNLAATFPDEMKDQMRKQRANREAAGRLSAQAPVAKTIEGEFEPVAGVNLSFESEFDIGLEFEPTSYIDLVPALYTKLRIKNFKLNHVAIDASIDMAMLLEVRATIEASASATAELDVIKLAAFLISGVEDYVARFTISPGLELELWAIVGITAGLDGHVEAVPWFETSANAYGGAYYSRDWDDIVWDNAPDRIQEGRKTWNAEQWYTAGESDFSADAGLDEFSWGAHGGIEAYLTAKYALSFLRCGGPTFVVQPYIGFNAWIGDKNKLEAAMGVRGNVGGKIEIIGEETIWEKDWEVFDYKYILWEYSWMLCGDGIRSTECYDLECDHCPNAGCGGEPEECDAGIFATIKGQGSDALGDAKPCTGCTCGMGWAPATGDEWFWPPTAEDDVQWGDKQNWCVRTCGNGIVEEEEGEVCDHSGSPGCDSNCNEDCTAFISTCGDGKVECHETCDDGNSESCDGCSELCVEEPGSGGCGDGYRCGDEECDDANDDECDGCYSDCTRRVYSCGDGHVCGSEACDDGNIVSCDGCSANCRWETGCGDNFTCGAEECDDGNLINEDGCSDTCELEGCGDGVLQLGEECDDGNEVDCDGCHNNCRLDTGCGDGTVCTQQGEQCEDRNQEDCDACHNDCKLNVDQCGDGHACGDEVCDDGNYNYGDGCSVNCMSDESCGNGVLDSMVGEPCDDNTTDGIDLNCTASLPDCVADCDHCDAHCGDGIIAGDETCDVNPSGIDFGCSAEFPVCTECSGCVIDCSDNVCGDDKLCPGETCDDGNTDDCTGSCSADCQTDITGCGDGIMCGTEACDDGNTQGGDGCRADCLGTEQCNDGFLDVGEGCEDDTVDGIDTGCSDGEPDCVLSCSACSPRCGDLVIGAGEDCEDSSSAGQDDGCSSENPVCRDDCSACETYICGDGVINTPEICDGASISCLGDTTQYYGTAECNPNCLGTGFCTPTEYCGDDSVNGPELCDDGDADSCTLDCSSDCMYANLPTSPTCGDSIFECGEVCEDGNTVSGDGCSEDCLSEETCGNDYIDTAIGEQCDDGNHVDEDGCSADCLSNETCGNMVVDDFLYEVCDDGNNDDCVGDCASDCMSFSVVPVCGDGSIDELCEQCEDSITDNTEVDDGCTAENPNCNNCTSCSTDVCGDGITGSTEECDEGGICSGGGEEDCTTLDLSNCTDPEPTCNSYIHTYANGTFCLRECIISECGDGVVSSFEACEDTDPTNVSIDAGCNVSIPDCAANCFSCDQN
jgi:cysteine-rich repeat protein